jgi:hypothetical protein
MSHTVFDLTGNERIVEWKKFRNQLETSEAPLSEVAVYWSRAPFVNDFLDPNDPSKWPDPWHLVLDNRYDDLAISLGIAYTLKLTTRFMIENIEIHMSILDDKKGKKYPVTIGDYALNWSYREVVEKNVIPKNNTILIFTIPTIQ